MIRTIDLPTMTSRQLRVVISALVAVAILVPPLQYAAALGVNLYHPPTNHHTRSQQPTSHPVKARVSLAAPVRSASRLAPESNPRGTKQSPSVVPPLCKSAPLAECAVLHPVFRPLRC